MTTIPAKYRKALYLLVTVAGLVFGAWQASGGNWSVFAGALITSLTTALAAGNTAAKDPGEDGGVEPGSLALGIILGATLVAGYFLLR